MVLALLNVVLLVVVGSVVVKSVADVPGVSVHCSVVLLYAMIVEGKVVVRLERAVLFDTETVEDTVVDVEIGTDVVV